MDMLAWTRDSSLEAVQKHFEETGEDEDTQVAQMFALQTDREYRIMMGRDTRIRRDPLAMRMREDQIKQSIADDPILFHLFEFYLYCVVYVIFNFSSILSLLWLIYKFYSSVLCDSF